MEYIQTFGAERRHMVVCHAPKKDIIYQKASTFKKETQAYQKVSLDTGPSKKW